MLGIGLAAVMAVTVLVLILCALRPPPWRLSVCWRSGVRSFSPDGSPRRALGVLGLPVLVGLFGVAVTLGTLGRAWSGPANLLSHLDSSGTAVVGAFASVIVNNLPASSLLAARVPPDRSPCWWV